MTARRRSVIGLARARSPWFAEVAQWSASSAIAIDFLKCVSAAEVRARLATDDERTMGTGEARSIVAIIADASSGELDRNLIDEAVATGIGVIIVSDARFDRDWLALGASAVLAPAFSREELMDQLSRHGAPQSVPAPSAARRDRDRPGDPDALGAPTDDAGSERSWQGRFIAITGVGGCGRSTIAMALAQGAAAGTANAGSVALADLCSRADLAMYHDVRDVIPAVQELVEAHRNGGLSRRRIRRGLFEIDSRGYSLLLGRRRTRDWTALRASALEATLESMRSSFRVLVADIDAEFDGESETGSVDVADRNGPSRVSAGRADVVAIVGDPTLRGLHGIIGIQRDLVDLGVEACRILTVVNRSPRSPRARSDITAALAELGEATCPVGPVFVPERRQVEVAHGTAGPLPTAVVAPITAAVTALMNSVGASPRPAAPTHGDHRRPMHIDTRRAS